MAYVIGVDTGGTFTDAFVSDRGCLVLLRTEIVPADEPSYREWSVQ